ncbi:short chain dehydrogenase/reductase-like protein [Cadophora sp. MPI-SDFR-AT-0126]|nr:short chain dehydrogenase/reductase-like protein [Leotiomycetes sp. MPI-SDFR-AT-0126]
MATEMKKSVLITGCSPGGIGHALALEFFAQGLHVIATARTKEVINGLEAMGMSTLALNVNSSESIEAAKNEVNALTGGRLDILVNNAGRGLNLPALEVPLSEVRATFEVNLFSIIAMTQAFMPLLLSSKGLIINIGSVAAIIPYVFGSVYNASKAALHAYSQTLRLELAPFDVRVMVIVTGGVKSRIARTDRALQDGSLYALIEGEFLRRTKHSQEGAMPAEGYSRSVVRQALKSPGRQKKWVWSGAKVWTVWFVSTFLGNWVFEFVIPRMFGLARLKALRLKTKKS